jgi:hypothetical protein
VLKCFERKIAVARRRYREFVQKGIDIGEHYDLNGGGLIRSSGGLSVIKSIRRSNLKIKSDESMLGVLRKLTYRLCRNLHEIPD